MTDNPTALAEAVERVRERMERDTRGLTQDGSEHGTSSWRVRVFYDDLILLLAAATQSAEPRAPQGEIPVLVEWIVELARRDIMRTQTDFVGRMHQAMSEFEDICD